MARQLGISDSAALAAARSLLPGLLEGLRKFPGGTDALLDLAGQHGGEQLAANVMGQGQVNSLAGDIIIAQMGGIALTREDSSDEDAALRLSMAPLLVMLMVGYLWARAATGGLSQAEIMQLLSFKDLPTGSGPEPV